MKKTLIPEVEGAFAVDIDRFSDSRGYFEEAFSVKNYPIPVYQINVSRSNANVVRGMHVVPFSKICTCLRGRLFDVVADVRPDSPTYLNWYGLWLTERNCQQLYIPAGCAHGFFSGEDDTVLMYCQDGTYDPKTEREINWLDPKLNIKWPKTWPFENEYVLSDKDRQAPFL